MAEFYSDGLLLLDQDFDKQNAKVIDSLIDKSHNLADTTNHCFGLCKFDTGKFVFNYKNLDSTQWYLLPEDFDANENFWYFLKNRNQSAHIITMNYNSETDQILEQTFDVIKIGSHLNFLNQIFKSRPHDERQIVSSQWQKGLGFGYTNAFGLTFDDESAKIKQELAKQYDNYKQSLTCAKDEWTDTLLNIVKQHSFFHGYITYQHLHNFQFLLNVYQKKGVF